ncbi:hypothetical protein [Cylindrospermum sp. FACHB-282]|uniref:hypothetical protein n=1 Tax=Cylindrospermum sp. FACHB-282 TaxID=2692794 RepID=UPI00168A2835|nr:hypothetical protein [Cylindrospermum sp. FACHB-282]MBD2386004.1 hypothetical protein [Cylindrospermum sp. FACHB-282]
MLKKLISFVMMVALTLAITFPAHALAYKGNSVYRVGDNEVWVHTANQAVSAEVTETKTKTAKANACGTVKFGSAKNPIKNSIKVNGTTYTISSLAKAPSKASCKSKDPTAIPYDWK